jgi:fructan beta-fructosidase
MSHVLQHRARCAWPTLVAVAGFATAAGCDGGLSDARLSSAGANAPAEGGRFGQDPPVATATGVDLAPRGRDDRMLFHETWRPQYHFTPPYGWMNDPNGMVYTKGAFHLFYQFNPYATSFGTIGWGHAVGGDQVQWQTWPVAIRPDDVRQIFSGSVVIDDRNTSGLCTPRASPDDPDCLVAIYTTNRARAGLAPNQTQDIAASTDGGRTWTQFPGNPVLDENLFDFRDPKVIWHDQSQRWIMLVALPVDRKIAFYASPNLRNWQRVSEFGPVGATGGVWECPDLFSLSVDGDPDRWKWVLKVDLNPGHVAGGSGGQYFVGEFDGTRFVAEGGTTTPRWVDHGPDFYCATHWHFLPGELPAMTWIGWMNNWSYAGDVPTFPWRGTMTLPRTLGLKSSEQGPQLVQQPVEALRSLRGEVRRYTATSAADLNARLAPDSAGLDTFEMNLTLRPGDGTVGTGSARSGIRLLGGADRRVAAIVAYDSARRLLSVERTAEGNAAVNARFPGIQTVPLPLTDGAAGLRLFVDRNSIEVFSADGTAVITALYFPRDGLGGIEFFADVPMQSIDVELWPLGSIW